MHRGRQHQAESASVTLIAPTTLQVHLGMHQQNNDNGSHAAFSNAFSLSQTWLHGDVVVAAVAVWHGITRMHASQGR